MGLDFTAGFLGAVKGGANAVDKLSEERRHELAEQLKREALEGIQMRSDDRKFAQQDKLQENRLGTMSDLEQRRLNTQYNLSQEKEAGADRRATERNQLLRELNKADNDMRERISKVKEGSAEAAKLKVKRDVIKDVQKNVADGSIDISTANATLEEFEIPIRYSEETVPGEEGFLFNDPDTTKITAKKIGGSETPSTGETTEGTPASAPTKLSSTLESIVGAPSPVPEAEAKQQATAGSPPAGQGLLSPTPETLKGFTGGQQEGPPEPVQPKGILGNEQPIKLPSAAVEGDPATWKVEKRLGKYYIITAEGPKEMTDEQLAMWQEAKKEKEHHRKIRIINGRSLRMG